MESCNVFLDMGYGKKANARELNPAAGSLYTTAFFQGPHSIICGILPLWS